MQLLSEVARLRRQSRHAQIRKQSGLCALTKEQMDSGESLPETMYRSDPAQAIRIRQFDVGDWGDCKDWMGDWGDFVHTTAETCMGINTI